MILLIEGAGCNPIRKHSTIFLLSQVYSLEERCSSPSLKRVPSLSVGKTISDAAHEGDEEHFYKKGQQVIENAGTLSFSLTIEEVEALNQAALAWRICMAA